MIATSLGTMHIIKTSLPSRISEVIGSRAARLPSFIAALLDEILKRAAALTDLAGPQPRSRTAPSVATLIASDPNSAACAATSAITTSPYPSNTLTGEFSHPIGNQKGRTPNSFTSVHG